MVRVGILNVTGYAGSELARLLHLHPGVKLTFVTGRSAAGQRLADVFPHLARFDLPILAEPAEADIVFSALPHKASASACAPLIAAGMRVIDISADFRLHDRAIYEEWYNVEHEAPGLLGEATYGLPELHHDRIASSRLVANPGCYPTATILGLAPAIRHGMIDPSTVLVDAKSGASGAGRGLSLATHFCEANENVAAYSLGGHRHLPEMQQELEAICPSLESRPLRITFVPHLIPMTRGILSTCYADLNPDWMRSDEDIRECFREFYRGQPFVRIVDQPPQTKQTLGNNFCLVHPTVDRRTGRLVVVSCLDNLVKGAAGQAIQNMNLMLEFPETLGIDALAVYP